MSGIKLLLDAARGQYIPRDFVTEFDLSKWKGISDWNVKECSDLENEWYWDAWASIESNAYHIDDNSNEWILKHDGDLFMICPELMTTEEKKNWGFDDE